MKKEKHLKSTIIPFNRIRFPFERGVTFKGTDSTLVLISHVHSQQLRSFQVGQLSQPQPSITSESLVHFY